MTAAMLSREITEDDTPEVVNLIPFFLHGAWLGCTAFAAAFVIDSIIFITALGATNATPKSTVLPQSTIVLIMILSVVVSLLMGHWLFRLRRWVGLKGDPDDHDMIRRKRRYFTIGSMLTYVPVTPLVWLSIIGVAISST